jgi:hypothetical protein
MVLLGAYSALLVVALVLGATLAWLVAGRALRQPRQVAADGLDAQDALRRHPAGRARWEDQPGRGGRTGAARFRPVGPDDDQEFIDLLGRQIRGLTDPGAD